MKNIFLFILPFFLSVVAKAQVIMQQRWIMSYEDAYMAAPLQLEDSSFVVTGNDDSSFVRRALLVKLDKYGDPMLEKAYGCSDGSSLYGRNIIQTADKGFFIVADQINMSGTKGVAIRLDASGNVMWAKIFNGRFLFALSTNVVELSDGGFAFCVMNNGSPPWKALIAKLSAQGDLEWAKTMPDNSNNAHSSLCKKTNGNILLVWESPDNKDVSVMELDAAGNALWGKTYKSSGTYHWAQCINIDAQGNILLAGIGVHNTPMAPYTGQPTITKLDPSGNFLWKKKYNSTWSIAEPLSLDQDHNGDYVLSLEPENVSAIAYNDHPRTIMKVNSNGDPISLQHSMDNFMTFYDKMKLTDDAGMIGIGRYSAGGVEYSTIIKSGSNNESPCYTDNLSAMTDSSYSVTTVPALSLVNSTLVLSDLSLYVTAPAYTVTLLCRDSALVTIENSVSINEPEMPFHFSIVPNPSSNSPRIFMVLDEARQVKVDVTNLRGERVESFTFDLLPGAHELNLPLKVAAGTYLITVSSNNSFSTKQFVLTE